MIAIVSDIHDNLANLSKFCEYINKRSVDKIICLGDVTSDLTLKFLTRNFPKEIHLVRGNSDFFNDEYLKTLKNIHYYGEIGEVEIGEKKCALVHTPETMSKLDQSKYDYMFYGHTHKPWTEEKNNTTFLNPGTLAGTFTKSTFAIWDEVKNDFSLILTDEL